VCFPLRIDLQQGFVLTDDVVGEVFGEAGFPSGGQQRLQEKE
jgi:hypothetical protein